MKLFAPSVGLVPCGAGVHHTVVRRVPGAPIKMIVAWAPGGSTDAVARIIAKHLSDRLKQQVLVENRSGASGQIGTSTWPVPPRTVTPSSTRWRTRTR